MLVSLFPALALPNVNQEEILLDLDDLLPAPSRINQISDNPERRSKSKERKRHRSDSRERRRSSSTDRRHRDHRDHKRSKRSSSRDRRRSRSREEEIMAGIVYRGKITRILDFGMFVQLNVYRAKEGLVHVS